MKRSLLSAFLIGSLVFLFACTDSTSPTSAMEDSVDGKVMNDKTPPPESGVVERFTLSGYPAIIDDDEPHASVSVGYDNRAFCENPETYVPGIQNIQDVYPPSGDGYRIIGRAYAKDIDVSLYDISFNDARPFLQTGDIDGFCNWVSVHLVASGQANFRFITNDLRAFSHSNNNALTYSRHVNGRLQAVDGSWLSFSATQHCKTPDGNDLSTLSCTNDVRY